MGYHDESMVQLCEDLEKLMQEIEEMRQNLDNMIPFFDQSVQQLKAAGVGFSSFRR